MVLSDAKRIFKQIPFFSEFNDDELQEVMKIGHEKSVESGQLLFKEGDAGDYLYIILEGRVRVFHSKEEEQISLSTLDKGAFFGEIALFDGRPRSASVSTLAPCHLFYLGRVDFINLLTHSNHMLFGFMRGLSTRIRSMNHDFIITSLQKRHVEDLAAIDRHRDISQMVAGVAHEINTPISIANQGAIFISETLTPVTISAVAKDEPAKEILRDVVDAAKLVTANTQRADTLVRSFQNLSVRQVADSLEEVDLGELMNEIIVLYPVRAKNSKFTIEVDNRIEGNGRWLGYPGYLTQILLNLINNAEIHAYSKNSLGSVQIMLTTDMDRYLIKVKDFGCGISEENVRQVFTAFFTTKRGQGGTGLGMAIVHNLVTSALQGTIEIGSKVGKGTIITIRFPKRLKVKNRSESL